MTKAAEQILEQALALDAAERADLVDQLITTLEPSTDRRYVSEWTEEIKCRIDEHESGETQAIPWEEARRRIFGDSSEDTNA